MSSTTDTTITFTAGRYSADQSVWEATAPMAIVSLTLFRVIFDAVGEDTIDTAGDIDPGVLLRLLGLGPAGAEEATAWVRPVCRWGRCRSLRVGFGHGEPME